MLFKRNVLGSRFKFKTSLFFKCLLHFILFNLLNAMTNHSKKYNLEPEQQAYCCWWNIFHFVRDLKLWLPFRSCSRFLILFSQLRHLDFFGMFFITQTNTYCALNLAMCLMIFPSRWPVNLLYSQWITNEMSQQLLMTLGFRFMQMRCFVTVFDGS